MSTPADQVFTSPTTPTGAATPSQYPQGGATTPAGTGGNWLSTLGSDLGSVGSFVSQNQNLLGGLATAGVGLYQAGQATQAGKAAAGQIQGTVTPSQNLSTATLGQLQGQGTVGGPMGTAIAGQTAAAGELTGVAQQYGTGQLTSAQQTQIQQQVAAQKAQVDQQFAASGNMNSSARDAAHQQIDNNAAILTQQLINQNLQMAEGAQTSVTGTYNALLGNALNQANLGLHGTATAVQTQLQQDQQVAQYLQQILGGIATGVGTAAGGTPSGQTTAGGQAGAAIGSGLQKLFSGGGGAVAQPQTWNPTDLGNMVNTESAAGQATQDLTNTTANAIQNWQPSLDLSTMDTSSIDYSGYTGG